MSILSTIKMNVKELKQKAKLLEPAIKIGKNGLTDGLVKEIKRQLEKKKLVKIKLLRPFIQDKDKKIAAKEIAEKTDSVLIDSVGFVVVLHKMD